jgi:hypothetical protein
LTSTGRGCERDRVARDVAVSGALAARRAGVAARPPLGPKVMVDLDAQAQVVAGGSNGSVNRFTTIRRAPSTR